MAVTLHIELKGGITRDAFRVDFLSSVQDRREWGGAFDPDDARHPHNLPFVFAVEPTEEDVYAEDVYRANIIVSFGNDDAYYDWKAFSAGYFSRIATEAFHAGAGYVSY